MILSEGRRNVYNIVNVSCLIPLSAVDQKSFDKIAALILLTSIY